MARIALLRRGPTSVSSPPPRNPVLVLLYRRYLDDQDSAAFIGKVSQSYTQSTRERLAQHESAEIRRGAVLALGFLADFDANPVLGMALVDSDRTVRMLAENGIRDVWNRAGSQEQRQQLGIILRLNTAQQYEEAVRALKEACRLDPRDVRDPMELGDMMFERKAYAQAAAAYRFALRTGKEEGVLRKKIGETAVGIGDKAQARMEFEKALVIFPEDEELREALDGLD